MIDDTTRFARPELPTDDCRSMGEKKRPRMRPASLCCNLRALTLGQYIVPASVVFRMVAVDNGAAGLIGMPAQAPTIADDRKQNLVFESVR
jgi:hypothetical protein